MTPVERMLSELQRLGDMSRWREPLTAVPRHLFVPEKAWCTPDSEAAFAIDRSRNPCQWMTAAYSDMSIVTQIDDGDADVLSGVGEYTSSLSAPSVVLAGLSLLDTHADHRVLEIGTGTGWTAGLLSYIAGDDNVVSIEIDTAMLDSARTNLRMADHNPRLVRGDGSAGWPEGAPYDRVHVTCGVSDVPYTWVAQTRPGGVIVFPWMSSLDSGQLTRLVVGRDGTAAGHFHGSVNYMMLRAQRAITQHPPRPEFTGMTVTPEGQALW